MYAVLRQIRSKALIVILFLLAFTLFSNWSRLSAQTQEPEQPEVSDPNLTDAMRRFLENREETEIPERMGATPCVAGMAGPYPCDNVDLMTFIPVSDFSASYTNDIWGWTDPLDGKEYAILGVSNGTVFVDVTDPVNPVYLGKLPTQTSNSPWRDIKVYNNYAFVVSEAGGHGMQVFDLTELRSVVGPPVTFSNDAHYDDFGSAHNIAINEDSGYAYGLGTSTCSGGLHMVNIQNPLVPTSAGCYSGDGYTHDAQCVIYNGPDQDYQGAEICFNSNEDTLTIVDVTDKGDPDQISRTGYSGSDYTHQGWLLDGQRYFVLGDEGDEFDAGHNTRTYIWDLLDLDNPVAPDTYTGPNPSVDHNMYVVGSYLFQSNYSSGLQILDLSDVANGNLTQEAYFDTYPANNNASYNGSWSNYPFFDSGIVVASGIDEGLFILQPVLSGVGTLVRSPSTIEEMVTMGEVVTRTLTVSNTGTVSFTFTTSESAAWAEVQPAGGTLEPGQSVALSVVLDSSATAGPGHYTDAISFSGSYTNTPADVSLSLHVEEEQEFTNYVFMPLVVADE